MGNQQQPPWLRGSFPQWLVVALLSIIIWGANKAFDEFRSTIAKAVEEIHNQDKRITVLEDWRKYSPR